jgi:signal transduction histidine kinase/CheY-like chemotaxis protein
MLLGMLTVLGSGIVGYYAYVASRNAILKSVFASNLQQARDFRHHVEAHQAIRSPAESLHDLQQFWGEAGKRYAGSYLCVVDSNGTLTVHTARADTVGKNIGKNPLRARQGPQTLHELVQSKHDWVGYYTSSAGEEQVAAFAYSPFLDALISVHVPATEVYTEIRATVLPWITGFAVLTAVLLPLSLGLLHHAYTSSQRLANRTYRALQESEEQLRQAQKMEAIGTLAGGIAHDFNNILAAILGYTELAMSDLPTDTLPARYLQEIFTAGQRAKDLVQQILTFSRQSDHECQPVQLRSLIQEALTLLRASLPSTIELRCHLSPEAGAVWADPIQMHQIVLNLCTNAAYAMRETGGIIEVRLEPLEVDDAFAALQPGLRPGAYVRLTVRDTGCGMAPAVLARVFEPFFTTKGVGEGTGMGLALVHGIVASHGGVITAQSTPEAGTTFEVYLPRLDQPVDPATATEEPLPQGQGCILLVDDEAMLVRMGHRLLERLGYEVVSSTSSLEALEVFRAMPQHFDLVLTDQTMPHMTGERLAQELRHIRPDIPIILCTGFSHVMNADRAQALGIEAFLLKPLVARDLGQVVQQVLERRRTPAAALV